MTQDTRPTLTQREYQVLQGLCQGQSLKQIAQQLGISAHTVKHYKDHVKLKLGAKTDGEAIYKAAGLGLI